MASSVDLHTHTSASDGKLGAPELLALAARLQVRTLAISDHDSTAGYEAALPLLHHYPGLQLIPAIEMNAEGRLGCHILGYWIDTTDADLQRQLARFRDQRAQRAEASVNKLKQMGVSIEWGDVQRLALGGCVGRPHIADALIARGVVRNRQEAFDRFLKKDGPAYTPADTPTAEETIQIIRRASGIPVLAHPSYYSTDPLIQELAGMGLMGIEVFYPGHTRALIEHYQRLARDHGLLVTGGSDYHGPKTGRSDLACVSVPESVVAELDKARTHV